MKKFCVVWKDKSYSLTIKAEEYENSNIEGFYGRGIILYGLNFPTKLLKFQIDLQLV